MAEQFRSQEEIDALLEVAGNDGAAPGPATPPRHTKIEPYDLARQERIVRGRMPALELINERFSRNIRIGLFNFMRRNPEVTDDPVVVVNDRFGIRLTDVVTPAERMRRLNKG